MAMSRRLSELLARLRVLVRPIPQPAYVIALNRIERECEFFRRVM